MLFKWIKKLEILCNQKLHINWFALFSVKDLQFHFLYLSVNGKWLQILTLNLKALEISYRLVPKDIQNWMLLDLLYAHYPQVVLLCCFTLFCYLLLLCCLQTFSLSLLASFITGQVTVCLPLVMQAKKNSGNICKVVTLLTKYPGVLIWLPILPANGCNPRCSSVWRSLGKWLKLAPQPLKCQLQQPTMQQDFFSKWAVFHTRYATLPLKMAPADA